MFESRVNTAYSRLLPVDAVVLWINNVKII